MKRHYVFKVAISMVASFYFCTLSAFAQDRKPRTYEERKKEEARIESRPDSKGSEVKSGSTSMEVAGSVQEKKEGVESQDGDTDGSIEENKETTRLEGSFQRSGRMEFDERIVKGQAAKSGAVYLFKRTPRRLPGLVPFRRSYRTRIVQPVLGKRELKVPIYSTITASSSAKPNSKKKQLKIDKNKAVEKPDDSDETQGKKKVTSVSAKKKNGKVGRKGKNGKKKGKHGKHPGGNR